jgi:3-methyl-2-oxobutanoate hydroxymethyltransferase
MSTFTIDTSTSRATPSPVPGKRTTAPSIRARKVDGKTEQPIVMLTAYTMRMAQLLDPHCDMLLVGDSLGQVIYGLPSTIPVTMEMMCAHGAAVVRGSWHALVAVDMPFGSYEASPAQAFESASRIMKETGCAAVKLEGGEAMAPTIEFLTRRGIPVIGHVGLTPQAVNVLGGYGARGKAMPRRIRSKEMQSLSPKLVLFPSWSKVSWSRSRPSWRKTWMCRSSASAPRPIATGRCW